MKSTIATILGTTVLGFLKGKLGSNARKTPITKKQFDRVLLPSGFIVEHEMKIDIFTIAPEIDGILFLHFYVDENPHNCWGGDDGGHWCMGTISFILDPNGKYAKWNEDEQIRKDLIEFCDSDYIFEYAIDNARKNNLDIQEENAHHGVSFRKADLLVDIYGNPIIKSGKEYDVHNLRRR